MVQIFITFDGQWRLLSGQVMLKRYKVFKKASIISPCILMDMYGLLPKCEVKMARYLPSSFFVCLWTEMKSRSINSPKKNEANIQPS